MLLLKLRPTRTVTAKNYNFKFERPHYLSALSLVMPIILAIVLQPLFIDKTFAAVVIYMDESITSSLRLEYPQSLNGT